MKTLALVIVSLLLVALAPPAHAKGKAGIERIIKKEGAFIFTDGSSTYHFKKGGVFLLEPITMSGRSIRGVWRSVDFRKFTITGKWSWLNGISRMNDYRRMKLSVSYNLAAQRKVCKPAGMIRRLKLYPVYFTLEELVAVSKAAFEKAKKR